MPRLDAHAPLCGNCGRWSASSESGLVPGTGYCTYWERLREQEDTCAEFLGPDAYRALQRRLAEANREWLDE